MKEKMRGGKYLGYVILLEAFFFTYGCKTNRESERALKIDNILEVTVDTSCKIIELQGIDSYSFKIVATDSLVLYGELGSDINKLLEPDFPVLDIQLKDSLYKGNDQPLSEKIVNFSAEPEDDQQVNTFSKNYYYYDSIGKFNCRLVKPKKPFIGLTGIYVSKLKDGRSFCLYAEDLDSAKQIEAMKIFYSLRYYQGK